MIQRYPHTSVIKFNIELDNGTSIPDVVTYYINIKGRFEPTGRNANLNYKAKWYCPKSVFKDVTIGSETSTYITPNNSDAIITDNFGNPIALSDVQQLADDDGNILIPIAGQSIEYLGTSYKITQAFSYQRHCEIWLD